MKPLLASKRRSARQISWEQILANLDDGVIALDVEQKVIFFNEASEVLTDISSGAAVGQALEQIFKREPWLIELVKTTYPPRQKRARGEGDLINRWGRKTPVGITVSPLQDRHGRFVGTILLLRDIKRRKELEEDLKRADRLALMGTLAAGLAHEIRNPLGGIKGAAQFLRRSADGNSSLRDFTGIMIREVDRVNQLIEQLLDLSRPAQLTLGPVNIHEILEDVLLLESQAVGAGEIHMKKWFDPEPAADPRRSRSTHPSFSQPGEKCLSGDGRRRRPHSDDATGNRLSCPGTRHGAQSLHLGRPRRRRVRHSRRRSSAYLLAVLHDQK